eukprot:6175150-Pleurochrysis_carterae.AAC.2
MIVEESSKESGKSCMDGMRPWKWRKRYSLVSVAGRDVLTYAIGSDAVAGLDLPSFEDMYPIHAEGGHRKARMFNMAVHNYFGGDVLR